MLPILAPKTFSFTVKLSRLIDDGEVLSGKLLLIVSNVEATLRPKSSIFVGTIVGYKLSDKSSDITFSGPT